MPFISKIQLPSGTVYDIKPAVSINFVISYKGGEPTEAILQNVPTAVTIEWEGGEYDGMLSASSSTYGSNIYLVKDSTKSGDIYDEWVTIDNGSEASPRYTWEKLGDTSVGLIDVTTTTDTASRVTTGTTTKSVTGGSTDTVIGSDATFSVTQPTISVTPSTTYVKASASGGNVAWNSKDSVTALTGVQVTADPSVTLASGSTGDVTVATGIGNATTKYLSASSSITGKTTNVATSVTPTTAKLATTTITGVNGTTSINVVKTRSSQTTNDGTWTALPSSTTNVNNNLLAGISVSNETLMIGAASLDTQTTYSAGAPESTSFVKAATSATTVATGSTTSSGSGADIVTNVTVGDTVAAVTSAPDITLTANSSTGTGRITYVQAQGTATTTKLSATASGTTVAANGTDTVIGTNSTFTVTQPTVSLATDSTSGTGKVQVATGISSASATGGSVGWNNKDQVTALTSAGSVEVPTISKTDLTVVTSVTPVQDEQ